MKLLCSLLQESERQHRLVLAAKEASLGASHVSTGITLNSLGTLVRKHGQLAEAETLLRRALDIREELSPTSLDAAVTRDELGCVLQAAGRHAEAREMRLRAGHDALACCYAPCSKLQSQAGTPHKACVRC